MYVDTPENEDWLKRHRPGRLAPSDPGAAERARLIAEHEGKSKVLKHGVSKKLLSPSFGSKRRRRNQLVARLKAKRKYQPPVRGGRKRKRR